MFTPHPDFQIYGVMQKENNLPYQFAGIFNSETQKFELKTSTQELLTDKINGLYEMQVYALDHRTGKLEIKKLKPMSVDFVEGNAEATNKQGRADFTLYDKIINIFEEP